MRVRGPGCASDTVEPAGRGHGGPGPAVRPRPRASGCCAPTCRCTTGCSSSPSAARRCSRCAPWPRAIVLRWVIDDVIVPRFEEGSVAAGTVVAGLGLIIGIGVVRAAGVVVRRTLAGTTQWRVAETARRGRHRPPRATAGALAPGRPTGDLVARAGVDVDAAVERARAAAVRHRHRGHDRRVGACCMLATDLVLGLVAVPSSRVLDRAQRRLPAPRRRHYNEAQDHLGELSAGVHESFEGVRSSRRSAPRARETERLAEIAGRLREARISAVPLRGTFEAAARRGAVARPTSCCSLLGAVRVRSGEPHGRRAVELRLPVHAARLPAAADRLRAVGAAALAGRLGPGARGARRADRARPDARHRASPRPASVSRSTTSRSRTSRRVRAGAGRRRPLDGRRPGASSPSSAPPAPASRRCVEIARRPARADAGAVAIATGRRRALVFQEPFLVRRLDPPRTSRWATHVQRRRARGRRCAWPRPTRSSHELPQRPRHRGRRAWRQPERRSAPARRARPGARAPAGAAAARRHDVGARPGDRGARSSPTCAGALRPARPC